MAEESQTRLSWIEPMVDALVAGKYRRMSGYAKLIAYVDSERLHKLQSYTMNMFYREKCLYYTKRGIRVSVKLAPGHTTTYILFGSVEGPQ